MTATPEQKASLRRHYRQIRSQVSQKDRQDAAQSLASQILGLIGTGLPESVLVTTSVGTELDMELTIVALQNAGHRLAWIGASRDLDPDGEPLTDQPGGNGISIPLSNIRWFLIPGLAFTDTGQRLGQGGGFFDRLLLRRHPQSRLIGCAFRCQKADSLPVETHDIAMDLVLFV